MPLHGAAVAALRDLAEGTAAWSIPIFCVGEFLRVVSHPRVFDPPTPALEAIAAIDALLRSPSVRLLTPGPPFVPMLRELIEDSGASGNLIFDAQIAALCLEHGARTLLSEDRDFTRFRGLEVRSLGRHQP